LVSVSSNLYTYTVAPSNNAIPSAVKKWPIRGITALGGDNLILIYYLSESENRPDKKDVLFGGRDLLREGATVFEMIVTLLNFSLFHLKLE